MAEERLREQLRIYAAELRARAGISNAGRATSRIADEIEERFLNGLAPCVTIAGAGITREPFSCPNCGATNRVGDNYCGGCARPLRLDCVACHRPLSRPVRPHPPDDTKPIDCLRTVKDFLG